MKLDQKTVLLTGASGGIGAAFAASLASAGATLILVGRDGSRLEQIVATLAGQGHRSVVADIATQQGRNAVVAASDGGIDLLINNAGINDFGLLQQQSEEQVRAMFELNALTPILLSKSLLQGLVDRQGVIVNVGSGFGSIGYAGYCVYSASKFALRGFTEALRRELADSGVRVHYLAPRATDTPMNSAAVVNMNAELGNATDSPARVAKELMQLLASAGASSRYIGWPEKFFVRLNALLPGWVDRALAAQLPIIRRYALAKSVEDS